jgi:monoamine oxidase
LCLIDFEELDPLRLVGDSDERFRVHEGNDSIPTRLAQRLKGQIKLEKRLVAVRELSDRRYRLTFVQPAGQTVTKVVDHVVFALPFSTLRQVDLKITLPEDKREVIRLLGYGTNAKVLSGFSARVWQEQESTGFTTTDNGLQFLWDETDNQPGRSGVLTRFVGGDTGVDIGLHSAEEQAQDALPLIDEIFPGAEAAYIPDSAVRMHWPSSPLFQGSYTCYRRGQTSFFGIEGRQEGNLYFCGEHTSEAFQGFMEGGAETGARAAAEILNDLGIGQPDGLRRMSALMQQVVKLAPPRGNQLRRLRRGRRPGFVRR